MGKIGVDPDDTSRLVTEDGERAWCGPPKYPMTGSYEIQITNDIVHWEWMASYGPGEEGDLRDDLLMLEERGYGIMLKYQP